MLEVPTTIYEQLGGRKFATMTGARNFAFSENSLQFDLPKDGQYHFLPIRRVARVVIRLENDLYTVVYYRRTRKVYAPFEELRQVGGLFHDQLCENFKHVTGLDTSL